MGFPSSGKISWCVPESDTSSISPARPKYSKSLDLPSKRTRWAENPVSIQSVSGVCPSQPGSICGSPMGGSGAGAAVDALSCCGCPVLLCHHPEVKHSFPRELRAGSSGPPSTAFSHCRCELCHGEIHGGFSQADLFAPFGQIRGGLCSLLGRSGRRGPRFSAGWILEGSPNIKALAVGQACEGDLGMRMGVRHAPMAWLLCWVRIQILSNPITAPLYCREAFSQPSSSSQQRRVPVSAGQCLVKPGPQPHSGQHQGQGQRTRAQVGVGVP